MFRGKSYFFLGVFLATAFFVGCSQRTVPGDAASSRPSERATLNEPQALARKAVPQKPRPRIVNYKPGIRIDFRVPQVEIEGEVILRKGALELFAYSKAAVPKEHESIVLLSAPPLSIYEALGLIGLRPGKPPRYFPETGRTRSASGDRVDVLVRYEVDRKIVEVSACRWMLDMDRKEPMRYTHWLFTGSERTEDGAFAANIEGTAVTVVDFPSSLLALPMSHSESNDALWLVANTDVIPKIGTLVTLVLRPVE